jgi:methionyl aminopeptidase
MDGWYVATKDHSLCSHYEHTILITDGLPKVLTLPDDDPLLAMEGFI